MQDHLQSGILDTLQYHIQHLFIPHGIAIPLKNCTFGYKMRLVLQIDSRSLSCACLKVTAQYQIIILYDLFQI